MDINNIYCVELEDRNGRIFEKFNTYRDYLEYVSDLTIESYDSIYEVGFSDLFNFKTWVVIFDNNGDLKSLPLEKFKALQGRVLNNLCKQ